jgi:hypothetical protein
MGNPDTPIPEIKPIKEHHNNSDLSIEKVKKQDS